jgi:hypothetical protein
LRRCGFRLADLAIGRRRLGARRKKAREARPRDVAQAWLKAGADVRWQVTPHLNAKLIPRKRPGVSLVFPGLPE